MDNKDMENSSASLDDILNSIPDDKTGPEEVRNEPEALTEGSIEAEKPAADTETDPENEADSAEQPDTSDEVQDDEPNAENEADVQEEQEPKEKSRPKKKRRKKKSHGRFVFGLLLTIIIVGISVVCAVYILKFSKELLGIDKSDVEIVVEIPMNSGTADIADVLYNEGIIDNTYLFRFFSKIKGTDGTYVAGPHTMSPKMTYGDMVEELQKGAVDERESVDIVFPEGITLFDAAHKLEDKGVCGADEFIRAFNTSDYGFDFEEKVKVSSLKFYKMEGYLFPDTYSFYVDEDARIVAKKFCRNFEAKITPDLYGRMNDLGMDLEETLTLASMVQAEAQSVYDMKRVASVFLNRLNNPDEYPLLQSDPTRKYVEDIIKPNIEVPSKAMFEAYDTYTGAGLPPGPICNPGLDAINAVLYPAETDYYYFCANVETGEVFYAKTLEEHNENLVLAGLA